MFSNAMKQFYKSFIFHENDATNDFQKNIKEHEYFSRFEAAGCSESLFKELVNTQFISNFDELYTGYTKSLPKFRGSINTVALMLCVSRDPDAVQQGIEKGLITKHIETIYGDTPLHLAALSGNLEVLQLLIKTFRYDLTKTITPLGLTALHYAAMGDNLELVQYLIENEKMNIYAGNYDALDCACRTNAQSVIAYLYSDKEVKFSGGLEQYYPPETYQFITNLLNNENRDKDENEDDDEDEDQNINEFTAFNSPRLSRG